MYEWTNERKKEWINEQMNKQMKERMYESDLSGHKRSHLAVLNTV